MTEAVYRPLVQQGEARPEAALPLAGGPLWFTHVERMRRTDTSLLDAEKVPDKVLQRLTAPRAPLAGLSLDRPRLMGILNTTPDSFSDGGLHAEQAAAVQAGRAMAAAGADILDVGGESTRPGAETVPVAEEIARTDPVIRSLRAELETPISIDTRKAHVARAALHAGANIINDVSGFTYDPDLTGEAVTHKVPVCVMHALGDPATMQNDPHYDNVVLDVWAFLEARVTALELAGVPRTRILVDPGIGFGKTLDHNLTLLRHLSVFHGLGCAILLGASRKRFIGTIGQAPQARNRGPGSIAVGLAALAQGVQILRVHDVDATAQAVRLWQAVR